MVQRIREGLGGAVQRQALLRTVETPMATLSRRARGAEVESTWQGEEGSGKKVAGGRGAEDLAGNPGLPMHKYLHIWAPYGP
jgi:hypothetical protein